MKVIYISPSNHGKGANKCLHAGCYEDKHTRPIAEALKKYLPGEDFKVVIAKAGTTMAQRVAESDKIAADLHMPIHTNASSDKTARYLMFMFYNDEAKYRKIFEKVSAPLVEVYGKKAVFSVRKDLYEINQPKAVTMYCELGFHTSKADCDNFIHKPDLIGKNLAKGICDYYGVKMPESKPDKEEAQGLYKVQVGAYAVKSNAEAMVNKLKEKGFDAFITK